MKHSLIFPALLALTACGPDINVGGMGTPLSQDEIEAELVNRPFTFTAPKTEGRYAAQMTLRRNGTIHFAAPVDEAGTWSLPQGTTDICLRFVVRFGGDPSCFGVSRLQAGETYVTDHGYLIRQLPRG